MFCIYLLIHRFNTLERFQLLMAESKSLRAEKSFMRNFAPTFSLDSTFHLIFKSSSMSCTTCKYSNSQLCMQLAIFLRTMLRYLWNNSPIEFLIIEYTWAYIYLFFKMWALKRAIVKYILYVLKSQWPYIASLLD